MLVLLKIPLVYLCMVVWWAIRVEPRDEQPTAPVRVTDTPDGDAPVHRRQTTMQRYTRGILSRTSMKTISQTTRRVYAIVEGTRLRALAGSRGEGANQRENRLTPP